MKKRRVKKNLTFRSEDLNPGFFNALDLNLREGEGDEIKSRQPSKRDRTLHKINSNIASYNF